MNIKKSAVVMNGFIHDFAAGYWLAAVIAIAVIHNNHVPVASGPDILNSLEHSFFWQSVGAMVTIFATGAGRTFTYVENWYGEDAERLRRKMLVTKHLLLLSVFGVGYLWIWAKVFH